MKKQIFDGESMMKFRKVIELDDSGVPTGRKVNVAIPISSAEALMMKYIKMAENGSERIMMDLIDRIDGKPTANVNVKTNGDLTLDEMREKVMEYDNILKELTEDIDWEDDDSEGRDTKSRNRKGLPKG